jgi:hypothetical protein
MPRVDSSAVGCSITRILQLHVLTLAYWCSTLRQYIEVGKFGHELLYFMVGPCKAIYERTHCWWLQ